MYALISKRELRGINIGGRGQSRLERLALEDYIAGAYKTADEYVRMPPFAGAAVEDE